MKVMLVITNILIILVGIGFVALSGYYIYEAVLALRSSAPFYNALMAVINPVFGNFLFILLMMTIIFDNRKLFINVVARTLTGRSSSCARCPSSLSSSRASSTSSCATPARATSTPGTVTSATS